MRFADGSKYVGEWKNNRKEGEGVLSHFNGSKFEGIFFNDKKEGPGKQTNAKGDVYIGTWINGQQHGNGVYHYFNGRIKEVKYDKGKLVQQEE